MAGTSASANRFAVLSESDVLVGSVAEQHSGSTPRASRQPTPQSSRAASPTPSLLPEYVPETWTYNGVAYRTLEDAIKASAEPFEIDEGVITWIIQVINSFTRRDVSNVYNKLGDKIYEHRNTLSAEIEATRNDVEELMALREQLAETTKAANQAMNENVTLHTNQEVLTNAVRQLSATVSSLKDEITKMRLVQVFQPQAAANTTSSAPARTSTKPKVAEPPVYKGNKAGDINLEQWLQKMGIWFRYQGIYTDDEKIVTGLMYLGGGVHQFMDDYAEKASAGLFLGSWQTFVDRLKSGYRQMSPEKSAQQSLDEICNKSHQSMAKFAEGFRLHATRSGYSDVELIRRIDQQRNHNIRTIMVTTAQIKPEVIPTTWELYLEWVLDIEMKLREEGDKKPSGTTSTPRQTSTQRDPNAMDIDTVRKAEKLSKEQEEWMSKGLCFRCGKHKALKKGERCRTPQYKGFYEFPTRSTQARVVDEKPKESDTPQESDRDKFIRSCLERYDAKGKGKAVEETARIEEVEEMDFLREML